MTLNEKTAYVKGLAEGAGLNAETPEGKVLRALLDLTGEMARRIEELEDDSAYMQDYLDEIDHDLGNVEQYLLDATDDFEIGMYDDEDDDDDDDDEDEDEDEDDACDGNCACCEQDCDGEDDEEDEDDEDEDDDFEYYEIECPSCGEVISVDSDMAQDNLICPACGEKFACIVEEDDPVKNDATGKKD